MRVLDSTHSVVPTTKKIMVGYEIRSYYQMLECLKSRQTYKHFYTEYECQYTYGFQRLLDRKQAYPSDGPLLYWGWTLPLLPTVGFPGPDSTLDTAHNKL